MAEIDDILSKCSLDELSEKEKLEILSSQTLNKDVIKYLISRLSNLLIEVLDKPENGFFKLMVAGKLNGWCWQTTESAIVFLNDDDYIERGYITFDKNSKDYYHSWICFSFEGEEYFFDPCLCVLCKKADYLKLFGVKVLGKVSAKEVREELIRQLTQPKEEPSYNPLLTGIIKENFDKYLEKIAGSTVVHAPEDVRTPLYRNGARYKAEFEDGGIKRLRVHYYYTDE